MDEHLRETPIDPLEELEIRSKVQAKYTRGRKRKLSDSDVYAMRRMRRNLMTYKEIGKEFGVSEQLAADAVKGNGSYGGV